MRSRWSFLAIASLPPIVLLAVVLFAGGSAGGTLASGRAVMAHSDALSMSTSFSADTATIQTAGRTICVLPTSLIIDGITVASIDESVADIQVDVQRGVVTFTADGQKVKTTVDR